MKKEFIILNIDTKEIKMTDLNRTLEELGYTVIKTYLDYSAEVYCEKVVQKVRVDIRGSKAACVITYDFSQSISEACLLENVPYVSWVFDAPQKELFTEQAFYPCNYIYVFDKKQQLRLQRIGLSHVYHTALAFKGNALPDELRLEPEETMCQVSFVGQLYRRKNSEFIVENIECIRQEFEKMFQDNFMMWGDEINIHDTMSEKSAQYLRRYEKYPMRERYPYASDMYLYEAAIWARALAHKERVCVLNRLAEKYEVQFYTRDEDVSELSDNVKIYPGISYQKAFEIYHNTKINLNITLHCIETGVPQRVFDVLASGGFLLSNYQKELVELFEPGKELVLFHNMQELEELTEYYLSHEEERRAIARAGQKKILQLYTYHNKLEQIFSLVIEQEKRRKESFIEMYRDQFGKRMDNLLKKREIDWLKYISAMCKSGIREENTGNPKGMQMLKVMLLISESPLKVITEELFKNIHSLRDIEKKGMYVEWLYEELYTTGGMNAFKQFRQEGCSVLFLYWFFTRREGVGDTEICELTKKIEMISIGTAIEFISYAIIENETNKEFYLQKADCLLSLGMVEEALNVLRVIPNSDDEVKVLIAEMEKILNE